MQAKGAPVDLGGGGSARVTCRVWQEGRTGGELVTCGSGHLSGGHQPPTGPERSMGNLMCGQSVPSLPEPMKLRKIAFHNSCIVQER